MNLRLFSIELKPSGESICCADRCADKKLRSYRERNDAYPGSVSEENCRGGTEVFVKITRDVGSNVLVKNGVYVAIEGKGEIVLKGKKKTKEKT